MLKTEKTRKFRSSIKPTSTPPAFLLKTYEILENSEFSDIISWNRDGDAFVVKRQNEFAENVLPKYFKHNNFQSFVRQLNMYDFHKSRQENHENIFKHSLFKRGHKELLKNIKRKATFEPYTSNLGNNASTQLAPLMSSGQDFDVERYNKDYHVFMQELINLKGKQEDLQHVTAVLIQQNNEILSENKILWSELLKNRDKKDQKFDKFVQMLMHFFLNSSSFPQLKPTAASTNSSPVLIEETKNIPDSPDHSTYFENKPTTLQDHSNSDPKMLPLCNLNDSDHSNEKFIKKLLKKLKSTKGLDKDLSSTNQGEYKFASFLENYYEKNMNLLQNLMKYMKNNDNDSSEGFSKLLAKRSAEYDISNSLKYLDDSIFNKRKKFKKMKGKKDIYLDSLAHYNGNHNINGAPPFFKKENFMDTLKLENHQNNAAATFNPFFSQNKMLTNFPNNPQNFVMNNSQNGFQGSQNNNVLMPPNYQGEMFPYANYPAAKQENQGNLLNSPFIEPMLSRKESINYVETSEDFANGNYQVNPHFNFDSPIRNGNNNYPLFNSNSYFGQQNGRGIGLKDEENEEQRSTISLNLDKLEG